ncbi:MAG: chitobiase/beta-hexosaminidase C-terminal domain-containing protein, partial [Bacteroidaceae bacterium]|nr:chitobiase/beta-hexosaminidase C-terminal domain-containing protein [Bacteroidaceae bacterium]
MRKTLRLIPLALALVCSAVSMPLQAAGDYASKMKLWYSSPSGVTPSENKWMGFALPIGNGQLGATFMGGVDKEYIQFNEKTLWTGASNDYNKKASEDGGSTVDYGAYQNFGVLTINTGHSSSSYSNYNRELNLMDATGKVEYTSGNVGYTREFIASYPDQVVAARFSANASGKLNLTFSLAKGAGLSNGTISYADGGIALSGTLESVQYASYIKIVPSGGSISTSSSSVTVSNANEVLVLLAAGTNYMTTSTGYTTSGDKSTVLATMKERTAAAANMGWSSLYSSHVGDYQDLFGRVKFDLNASAASVETKSLVSSYSSASTANKLLLEQLYFAYGRYLAIASSRGIALPSNLQGIWCNVASNADNWNSDIHANINVQMNYWPVEVTNLSETHMPFLDYIINMSNSKAWKLYATDEGGQTGWTTFTENNIFGGVGYWHHDNQETNAWFSNHLWQHFEYTMDYDFLVKALPTMKSACEFWFNRLTTHSDGTLVCADSYSPEHGPSGVVTAYTQQMICELFTNTRDAIAALKAAGRAGNSYDEFAATLASKLQKLDKGLATETYTAEGSYKGGFLNLKTIKFSDYANGVAKGSPLLREWKDYTYYADGARVEHRHLSHLMCMYPFNQVSATDADKTYFNAAVNSLQMRGFGATGWAMGWKINLWARAQNAANAYKILNNALKVSETYSKDESKGGVYHNLWSAHAPYQIDGNFGATSGITEMLFQSHSGVMDILPALPENWKGGGTITGLKGRGNFTVGITWTKDVNTANVTIQNNKGQACNVKCGGIDLTTKYVAVNGNPVDPSTIKAVEGKAGAYNIPSKQGDEITIDVTRASEYVAPVEKTVETPTFSPNGGEVQAGATVTIACATDGAKIYYTTNGTTPTTASTLYSGDIAVNQGMTLKAIAVKDGYTNSAVAQATFTIKAKEVVATPAFSISGGEVEEGTQVTISCATSGATVYYTTDGSAPSTSSAKYTGAITISKAMTIKAIAVKDGYYTNSQVASATFTIKAKEVVATPAFSISGGEVEEGTQVTISCATSGATVYYTTDGSAPSTSSAKYTGAITISKAMTIKAVAVKDGYYTNSQVASATFTIKAKEVVATPAISPNGGEYESSATVTLTCATEGASIYYTLDGSTPTTASTLYSKAFTL